MKMRKRQPVWAAVFALGWVPASHAGGMGNLNEGFLYFLGGIVIVGVLSWTGIAWWVYRLLRGQAMAKRLGAAVLVWLAPALSVLGDMGFEQLMGQAGRPEPVAYANAPIRPLGLDVTADSALVDVQDGPSGAVLAPLCLSPSQPR